jgi:hypothetical protein
MCAALHHAACNAAAHRFSQSAGVSDRSRVVLCEHIQHTESRAHERILLRRDNTLCSSQTRPVHTDATKHIYRNDQAHPLRYFQT